MRIPKEYKYLFDGSKRFYDYTDKEKNIYRYYLYNSELQRIKRQSVVAWSVFAIMVIILIALICLALTG